jgi:hypothetical protein
MIQIAAEENLLSETECEDCTTSRGSILHCVINVRILSIKINIDDDKKTNNQDYFKGCSPKVAHLFFLYFMTILCSS